MTEAVVEVETPEAEVETPAAAPPEPVAKAALSVEDRARLHGWKDKSEFDRPPERWVDAGEYLRRQDTNAPILKENLHRLEEKFGTTQAALEATRAELAANTAALKHIQDMSFSAETRAFERAKRELEARRDQAAATADVQTVRAASEELVALKPPAAAPVAVAPVVKPAPAAPTPDPTEAAAVEKFRAENSAWFATDDAARGLAVGEYDRQLKRPGMTPQERLAEVKRVVAKRFPEYFENPAASRPAAVVAPSGTGSTRGKATKWDSLPPEVRTQADKIIADVNRGRKDGKTFTREEYADTYLKANG